MRAFQNSYLTPPQRYRLASCLKQESAKCWSFTEAVVTNTVVYLLESITCRKARNGTHQFNTVPHKPNWFCSLIMMLKRGRVDRVLTLCFSSAVRSKSFTSVVTAVSVLWCWRYSQPVTKTSDFVIQKGMSLRADIESQVIQADIECPFQNVSRHRHQTIH